MSNTPEVTPGSLLISAFDLTEPTFRRSAIFLIEHNDAGSLGVVINRRSETAVHSVFPRWADLAADPKALYIGGPVKRSSAICLGNLKPGVTTNALEDEFGMLAVHDRTVMIDLDAAPEYIAQFVSSVRIFVGYAGWSIGQLADELSREDWLVVPSEPQDLVANSRTDVWGSALRRQPAPLRLLATHPIDLQRN